MSIPEETDEFGLALENPVLQDIYNLCLCKPEGAHQRKRKQTVLVRPPWDGHTPDLLSSWEHGKLYGFVGKQEGAEEKGVPFFF